MESGIVTTEFLLSFNFTFFPPLRELRFRVQRVIHGLVAISLEGKYRMGFN